MPDKTDWYYTQDGEEQGPITGAKLKELASSGSLQPTDSVRRGDWGQARTAGDIKNLFKSSASSESTASRFEPTPAQIKSIKAAADAADQVSQKVWFLDLKFEHFATPKLIGFVFSAGLVGFALSIVLTILYGVFYQPLPKAIAISVGSVVINLLLAIMLRVFLEGCLIAFRIADHLSYLKYLKPGGENGSDDLGWPVSG